MKENLYYINFVNYFLTTNEKKKKSFKLIIFIIIILKYCQEGITSVQKKNKKIKKILN